MGRCSDAQGTMNAYLENEQEKNLWSVIRWRTQENLCATTGHEMATDGYARLNESINIGASYGYSCRKNTRISLPKRDCWRVKRTRVTCPKRLDVDSYPSWRGGMRLSISRPLSCRLVLHLASTRPFALSWCIWTRHFPQ
jgi:hypothetical protein